MFEVLSFGFDTGPQSYGMHPEHTTLVYCPVDDTLYRYEVSPEIHYSSVSSCYCSTETMQLVLSEF